MCLPINSNFTQALAIHQTLKSFQLKIICIVFTPGLDKFDSVQVFFVSWLKNIEVSKCLCIIIKYLRTSRT